MANEELKKQNIERALQTAYELFLVNGLENTTKVMVAEASGLSRPSIDRYFSSHTDCVLQVAEYVGRRVRIRSPYSDELFTDGKHTGAELLRIYMEHTRELYRDEPRIFVTLHEFKNYVYRHCESFELGYDRLLCFLGNRQLIQKMYELGISDGSFAAGIDTEAEAEYFCESYLGFLSNMALTTGATSEKKLKQIQRYIDRVMMLYEQGTGLFGKPC